MTTTDLAAVEARLENLRQGTEKLARQNRSLKRAVAACFLLVAVLFLGGAAYVKGRKTVTVEELVLRDKDGRTRARLCDRDGPALHFYDRDGGVRASLSFANEYQSSLQFHDPNGKPRMMLYQMGESGEVSFSDAAGKKRARIGMAKDLAGLAVNSERGNGELGASDKGASLILHDRRGLMRAVLYTDNDKAEVYLKDQAGSTTFRKP